MKNETIRKYNNILESELIQYLVESDVNEILYKAMRRFEELEKLSETKVNKKKGKVNIECESRICEYTDNESLRESLREFCQIRELSGKPILSKNTITRLFNKLDKYGKNDEEKMNILEYSIDRNYQDIYPLKSGYGQKNYVSSTQNEKEKPKSYVNTPSLEGQVLEDFILGKNDLDNF